MHGDFPSKPVQCSHIGRSIMARKIYGTCKPSDGPVAGLLIEAWDSDPDGDDFMGRDTTNDSGAYNIEYAGGHWDPGIHAVTTWRPDIYIKVLSETAKGRKVEIARSKIYENQKLSSNRKIDLKLPQSAPVIHDTSFSAEKHGLAFRNSFSLKVHWEFDGVGFCGGMCACALNRFKEGKPSPSSTATPRSGSDLHTELLIRQIASLVAVPLDDLKSVQGVLSKLARPHTLFKSLIDDIWSWQKAPDEGHWYREHSVGYRTKKAWPALKERLDKGEPTLLILITQEGADPRLIGHNHQVIATGYTYHPLNKDLYLRIYDPNNGRKTETIYLNLGLPDSKLDMRHSNPGGFERARGFFINTLASTASA